MLIVYVNIRKVLLLYVRLLWISNRLDQSCWNCVWEFRLTLRRFWADQMIPIDQSHFLFSTTIRLPSKPCCCIGSLRKFRPYAELKSKLKILRQNKQLTTHFDIFLVGSKDYCDLGGSKHDFSFVLGGGGVEERAWRERNDFTEFSRELHVLQLKYDSTTITIN